MSPETVRRVKDSWPGAAEAGPRLARVFYERLFRLEPGFRRLFENVDMASQEEKFVAMLDFAVAHLDDEDAFDDALARSGVRHVGYGVRDRHYLAVGEALLQALKQEMGPGFTSDVQSAWAEMYWRMADVMRKAAQGTGILDTAVGSPDPTPA